MLKNHTEVEETFKDIEAEEKLKVNTEVEEAF
jgi:hypothetical protein